MPLLLFLILIFLFPWLFLLLVLLFYVLIPLGFTIQTFLWLIYEPVRLLKTVTDGRVRRNHGLMHATINVLEEGMGQLDIEGMPTADGFSLRGKIGPESALHAATEALDRLKRGEVSLAAYRRCGISVLFANTMLALVLYVLLRLIGAGGLVSAGLTLAAVCFAGSKSGLFAQRLGTVSSNLDDMEITGVEISGERVAFGGMTFFSPAGVFVRTRKMGAPRVAEVVSP
ncbi:MAG: hypothetical protein GX181_08510 [Synergistaceae bacterium]|nr:DUF6391 domain-containing protein [Synergistota bacterium]NLM71982.1 hypothetical protein [Synergistaceae bacterium]